MKSHLLIASAVGVIAMGGTARAADSSVTDYLTRLDGVVATRIAAAGVDVGHGLTFKAHIDGEGRLSSVHVVESSGSLDADQKAEGALRRFHGPVPPIGLGGREITVVVPGSDVVQAKVP